MRFPKANLFYFIFWNLEFVKIILELRLFPYINNQIDLYLKIQNTTFLCIKFPLLFFSLHSTCGIPATINTVSCVVVLAIVHFPCSARHLPTPHVTFQQCRQLCHDSRRRPRDGADLPRHDFQGKVCANRSLVSFGSVFMEHGTSAECLLNSFVAVRLGCDASQQNPPPRNLVVTYVVPIAGLLAPTSRACRLTGRILAPRGKKDRRFACLQALRERKG